MVCDKLPFYFILINQIVYEIITNLFTQPSFESTINLKIPSVKLSKTSISQNSDHCNFFPIYYKNKIVS